MKLIICLALLFLNSSVYSSNSQVQYLDGFIEIKKETNNFTIAPWGDLVSSLEKSDFHQAKWPFELSSIGHTISSFQKYGWKGYFHHGIDIRGESGQEILSATDGKIVNIENYSSSDLYWEVAVLDTNGFLWQYHHVDKDSITKEVKNAFESGKLIKQGTKLGTIVYWPASSYGELFTHIHLNVLDKDLNYINPFILLKKLDDLTAPVISKIGILKNGHRTEKVSVKGDYSIFIDTEDYILHTKYKVPPYKISYSLDGNEINVVWEFNNLPGGGDNEKYLSEFFQRDSCGNYNCRNFYINLNFNKNNPITFPSTKGEHTIKVFVTDFSGNSDEKVFQWSVR